ncbi:NapC/NirT family cytochrome c [Metallumcola ferriviriculae]|uniref:NapC/NirT family cytochrome c n=1 Tax=Metallumcola ferriviriculae TaxID=3039180 RepID=A0AAU0UME8_9FIRM|nr:NapC/NirT family cytochrome c [Desulfitibacteraceae bacterium MK1]
MTQHDQTTSSTSEGSVEPNKPKKKRVSIFTRIVHMSRIKLFFMALTAAVILLLIWFATPYGVKSFSSADTCNSCHVVEPEVKTWDASSHNRFDCAVCHEDYGLYATLGSAAKVGFTAGSKVVIDKIEQELQQRDVQLALAFDFDKGASLLDEKVAPVKDEVCLKCHSLTRQVTAGGLIVPHQKHVDKKIWCVSCHKGVAHGAVSGRSVSQKENDIGQLPVEMLMTPNATKPNMGTCMNCHERRKISKECETCHKYSVKPDSHGQDDFLQVHGKIARKDITECDSCHGYEPISVIPQKARSNAVEYARFNPFCRSCHGSKPPSHMKEEWIVVHGRDKELDGCFVCHDNTPLKGAPAAAKTNCNRCHYMKHREGWRRPHPIEVTTGPNKTCLSCHSERNCVACHTAAILK